MALTDEAIVREVFVAFRAMGEGRASLESAAADCFHRLLAEKLEPVRDPLQDDDEGAPAEPPRLTPATNTGD